MNLKLLKDFQPITLNQMKRIELLDRFDKKFCIPVKLLMKILPELKKDYAVLTLNNTVLQLYRTIYYDTHKNHLYLSHHNGKVHRFKIRKRTYLVTDTTFLEIKLKDNKGKTTKKRLSTLNKMAELNPVEKQFILANTQLDPEQLLPVLINQFHRLTLANLQRNERCTIDFDLAFFNPQEENDAYLSNLAIIEIKTSGGMKNSPLFQALKSIRIKSSGFSKYCIGRAILEKEIKKNNFKPKLRTIQKLYTPASAPFQEYAIGGLL